MTWSAEQARRVALGRLLHPHTLEEFGASFYERRPLYVERDDPAYYASDLKLSDLEDVLYQRRIAAEDCSITRAGVPVPSEEYIREGLVDPDRVSRLVARGAALLVEHADLYSAKVRRLCNEIEAALGHRVSAAVHLMQGLREGFEPSYDTHDTLNLQLEGNGRWRLYDPPYPLPVDGYPEQTFHRGMAVAQATSDIGMRAGDLLYLPRGFVREGWSDGGLSLHLSVGLHSIKWVDVTIEAVKIACTRDVALRATAEGPVKADFGDAALHAALRNALTAYALEEAKERLDLEFLTRTPNPLNGQLGQIRALSQLNEESFISIREPMFYHAEEWDEGLMLEFSGKRLSLSKTASGLITELAAVRVTRAGDLLKYGADALDIVRELINEGFIIQAARVMRRGPVLRSISR